MNEKVVVTRPTFNYNKFEEYYEAKKTDKSLRSKARKWKSSFSCSREKFIKILYSKLPVISWLPKYKKDYLFGDAVASATVGIIRVPQGMAYALLAGVPPVYGLYSCFFPVLLWFLFSTSKHTSVGTNAVICLMLQNIAAKHGAVPPVAQFNYNSTNLPQVEVNGKPQPLEDIPDKFLLSTVEGEQLQFDPTKEDGYREYLHENKKVQIVLSASLVVGGVQLIMAFCRLGFLTTLMPDPVIQGFTTGAAFHVAISQAKYIFGLSKYVARESGMFELFKTCANILKNLDKTNITDLIISVVCLPTMLGFKYLNQKYKKELRNIPIPIELILIIILTLASYFGNFHEEPFNVNIVKYIPTGFQEAVIPQYLHLISGMLTDCIIMALISVAVSLSLTKIYADKNEYETDANQEIFALGICNTVSTLVGSFAVAASLSRTAIQESAGGRTQLVSVMSSLLMLVVLLYLAPFFQPVPKSILACIIIAALKSFFMQFATLPRLWKVCKADFIIWVVTCLAVVLFGVDNGLFIGIFFSIAVLMYRLQHPKHGLLGRIVNTDLYANLKKYPDAVEICEIKIFQFSDSISYTNKDGFRKKLYKAIGFNPSKIVEKAENKRLERNGIVNGDLNEMVSLVTTEDSTIRNRNNPKGFPAKNPLGFSYLILDGTMWSFVDTTAAREMVQIVNRFTKLNITVMLAGVSQSVLKVLEKMDMFKSGNIKREHVYVTLHDSVVTAERMVISTNGAPTKTDRMELRPGYPGFDSLLL